jgi:hypothetical protein
VNNPVVSDEYDRFDVSFKVPENANEKGYYYVEIGDNKYSLYLANNSTKKIRGANVINIENPQDTLGNNMYDVILTLVRFKIPNTKGGRRTKRNRRRNTICRNKNTKRVHHRVN